MRFRGNFHVFCIVSTFFTVGGEVKAKVKVLDVLHSKDRTTSTEDGRTILSEKEFKEFSRQLKDGENDPKILSARQKLMNLKPVWQD